MWLLFVFAGADLQDGYVLWPDGQPPAQRLQADVVCKPADALCRPILVLLHQPAALPLQLPIHGSPSPGQCSPLTLTLNMNLLILHLTLTHELFQMPHEAVSENAADLASSALTVTNNVFRMK